MSEPFIGEIGLFGFEFAPRGWALCNGQLLPINQNQALFALLGTTYGGDGRVNFALPNLQGRVAIHQSNIHQMGNSSGQANVTLTVNQLPAHIHGGVPATDQPGNTRDPAGALPAMESAGETRLYGTADTAKTAIPYPVSGGSQPHNNAMPYLGMNYCIAMVGIFPSRN